jgi:hypothetical protein
VVEERSSRFHNTKAKGLEFNIKDDEILFTLQNLPSDNIDIPAEGHDLI